MEHGLEVVKNQKFDFGRIINPTKCDCKKCDFLNCPKRNYAVKMRYRKYTVKQYIEYYSDELRERYSLRGELLNEFMDLFTFPKGTYWNTNSDDTLIEFVSFSRRGGEVLKGMVNTRTGEIWDYDFSAAQQKLASRVSKGLIEVNKFMKKMRG